jgi:hypothetical protein
MMDIIYTRDIVYGRKGVVSSTSGGHPAKATAQRLKATNNHRHQTNFPPNSTPTQGIDVQYPRGAVYPGVFQFMFELTVHSSSSPMNLAVLTARAEEFKAALELKPTSPICVKAKRAGEKAGVRGWGVGPVLYGSVAEWVNQANKGRRKFR